MHLWNEMADLTITNLISSTETNPATRYDLVFSVYTQNTSFYSVIHTTHLMYLRIFVHIFLKNVQEYTAASKRVVDLIA